MCINKLSWTNMENIENRWLGTGSGEAIGEAICLSCKITRIMRQGHKQRWHGTRCAREKGRVGRVMSVVRTQETQDTRRNTRLAWKGGGIRASRKGTVSCFLSSWAIHCWRRKGDVMGKYEKWWWMWIDAVAVGRNDTKAICYHILM